MNIENVVLRTTSAGSKLDLSASNGVTNVTIANSSIAGEVDSVGDAALGVSHQNVDASFDGSTAAALNLTLDTVGKAGTPITVNLGTGVAATATSATINVNNANVDVASTHADAALTSATINATGTNAVTLTDFATTLTTLNVNGSGSVDLSGVALTAVTTLNAGDGGVTADFTGGALETATTGAGNDALDVVGSVLQSVNTGAGNDTVTVHTDALTSSAVINLGAGDDTLILDHAPAAGATLNGGDGVDTIAMDSAAYATVSGESAANLAHISGFETLSITDALATGANIDVSKIAGITNFDTVGVAASGTATVSNVGANSTVSMQGDLTTNTGALDIVLHDATGNSDVVNLNLASTTLAAASTTVTVAADGVETVNVHTSTTDTNAADVGGYTLSLTDDALTTLNVTGNQAFSFTSAATQTNLTTIDASGSTAAVTIDVHNAADSSPSITITGSDKADTFTLSNNADVTGHGGNDTFNIDAPASGQTYSTIEDAHTGNILAFAGETAFDATQVKLQSTAVFQDYLDAAASKGAGTVAWFEFDGNTYVVEGSGNATYQNGNDMVVKLTGIHDLTHAVDGTNHITLA